MSPFKTLDAIEDALCKVRYPCDWEPRVQMLKLSQDDVLLWMVLKPRLAQLQAAIELTGPKPTIGELIACIRNQDNRSNPGYESVLHFAASSIATSLLHAAWPHATVLAIIKAARDYQLSLFSPRTMSESDAVGIISELAIFAEGWLATL